MKSGDDDRGTRRTYKTRELLPVPIRLVPLCCYSSLPCVYGLIFHNRTGNRATNHFYFSSSFFPLIHQFPSIGMESGRVIGRDEINFTPLFVPRLPTTNCVLYFLARVFDLISDDPVPRSSNSRVQTKHTYNLMVVASYILLYVASTFSRPA